MLRALLHFELWTSRLATGSVPSSLGLGASREMALSLERVRWRSTDTRLATRETWLSDAHLWDRPSMYAGTAMRDFSTYDYAVPVATSEKPGEGESDSRGHVTFSF